MTVAEQEHLEYIAKDERDKIADQDFAWQDERKFPIDSQTHLDSAAKLLGHAPEDKQAMIKRNIICIAQRKGFSLPDSWKDDSGGEKEPTSKESLLSSASPSNQPKTRIATLQVCWIEDGVRSLNGRLYTREAVDLLIASGQRKLSDTNALPITCFLSHADADNDHTHALIGRVTKIWREGPRGIALIDLADTGPARDALALVLGGYLRTESLRAKNAELRADKRYDVPVVGGANLELEGIDFTNYPGLEQVARIQQVQLAESTANQLLTEVFSITPFAIAVIQEGQSMLENINEVGSNNMAANPSTSGNAPCMTNDPTQDNYGKRMYQTPPMSDGLMQGMTVPIQTIDVQEAHDRIAMVQNRSCAPARESARWTKVAKTLTQNERILLEAGKSLSAKNDAHLDAAHHAVARHLGMSCEGVNNKQGKSYDPDQDGGDDPIKQNNMESAAKKGTSSMTEEEALKLLEAKGYTGMQKPKTEAELLKEQLAVLQAEQAALREAQTKQLEEMKTIITQAQQAQSAPQRRSQVLGANIDDALPKQTPLYGKHLQEQINQLNWGALADRTCPLPENIPLDLLQREFEHYYAIMYDEDNKMLSYLL